jgi:tripartite-type tricarboxylate transporter receptor subunit TctC
MRPLTVAAVLLLALGAVQAQQKTVFLIVPYAAGGGPDVQARQFGAKLAPALGVPVVVENKVGAAGVLAAQYVKQAKPDGNIVLLGASTHLVLKHLQPDLGFDPIADFVPVINVATSPTVLVVRADSPVKSARDLVAALKANPGKMNYSSGGIGTAAHLAGASFLAINGVRASHIPLKGSVEIAASLLRGDTDFAFPITGTGVPQVKSGKLRALGVTSAARLAELPDVPTLLELFKNELLVQESWYGLWAPAKTPAEAVKRLFAASLKALADPELQQQFLNGGAAAAPSKSPEEFAAFVKSENAKWAQIVKLSSAKAE